MLPEASDSELRAPFQSLNGRGDRWASRLYGNCGVVSINLEVPPLKRETPRTKRYEPPYRLSRSPFRGRKTCPEGGSMRSPTGREGSGSNRSPPKAYW